MVTDLEQSIQDKYTTEVKSQANELGGFFFFFFLYICTAQLSTSISKSLNYIFQKKTHTSTVSNGRKNAAALKRLTEAHLIVLIFLSSVS